MTDSIERDWNECMRLWRHIGRVEDFPRNERRPKYAPSEGKTLGLNFAKSHVASHAFLTDRLTHGDDTEQLCAFECLEYMCREIGAGQVPKSIFALENPIPTVIVEELHGDLDAEGFTGNTVGTWFAHIFTGHDA